MKLAQKVIENLKPTTSHKNNLVNTSNSNTSPKGTRTLILEVFVEIASQEEKPKSQKQPLQRHTMISYCRKTQPSHIVVVIAVTMTYSPPTSSLSALPRLWESLWITPPLGSF